MKIAVNTKLLLKDRLEGIGWFEYETLSRITRAHPEHQFYFIFDRPYDKSFLFSDNVHPLRTLLPSRHPLLWYIRFHHIIPQILTKYKIDLFFSPDGYNVPPKFRSIIALHDLNYVHFPENLPSLARKYYKEFLPQYTKNAQRIVTVSDYSRRDIAHSYGVDISKIDVVYNGSSDVFKPLLSQEKDNIKKKYTNGKDYFVFVGALNPRKNLIRLLSAFDEFCSKSVSDAHLLIAGVPMFRSSFFQINHDSMRYKDRVAIVGRLNRDELAKLVGASMSLVLPSTFEGFGIPIIEAMSCDVPVITSNITAMPEVAGDAAIYIDPYSVESITEALVKMATEPQTRKDLIMKGRQRREIFSWDKTAEFLWQSIEKCLQ
jgi:glycosyltransferase involved in cell wall biosynthesis